jgi:pyruvate ferredoxin oxidoreductase alpha subunit
VHTAIAGLGGRPIFKESLRTLFLKAHADALPGTTFVDLDEGLIDTELARMLADRRSGPHAENMLRELGTVRAGAV